MFLHGLEKPVHVRAVFEDPRLLVVEDQGLVQVHYQGVRFGGECGQVEERGDGESNPVEVLLQLEDGQNVKILLLLSVKKELQERLTYLGELFVVLLPLGKIPTLIIKLHRFYALS